MKVAISSQGKDLESMVDIRFGRCPYFLIVDIGEGGVQNVEVVENTGTSMMRGAGIAAAQKIGNCGAGKVITGNIGPNSHLVLSQLGIEIYRAAGKVKDAVEALRGGKLEKIETPGRAGRGMGGRFGRGRGPGGGGGRRQSIGGRRANRRRPPIQGPSSLRKLRLP